MHIEKILYTNIRSGTNTGLMVFQLDLVPEKEPDFELIRAKTTPLWSEVLYFPLSSELEQQCEDELFDLFRKIKELFVFKIMVKTTGGVLFKWYQYVDWIIADANSNGYTGVFSNEVHFQARDLDAELPFTPENVLRYCDISRLDDNETGFRLLRESSQPWKILTHSRERYTMELYIEQKSPS